MNKISIAFASLAIAAAGAALAQDPSTAPAMGSGSKTGHSLFGTVDSNKDGRISRDEIKGNADLTSSFAGLDTDHDSYLSETEYGNWKSTSAPKSMAPSSDKTPGNTSSNTDGVIAPSGDSSKSTTGAKEPAKGAY